MEFNELLDVLRVRELSAATRSQALAELTQAVDWNQLGLPPQAVLAAVEEREAAAQTIVAQGMALPHATIDWDGDLIALLGRSRKGIDYGVRDHPIHIVVLLLFGKRLARIQGEKGVLQVLSKIAELFQDVQLRNAIVQAADAAAIHRLMREAVGLTPAPAAPTVSRVNALSAVLVEHAVRLTDALQAQALLLAVDRIDSIPWWVVERWPGKLLIVTSAKSGEAPSQRSETHFFDIPHAELSRLDRANLGLLLAAAKGHVTQNLDVVCVTGPRADRLDSITVTTPVAHFQNIFQSEPAVGAASVGPAIILRTLSLAIELGSEGREGKPVGAVFVIGDSRRVLRQSQQLVLNPFHGYSHRLRNVLDPSLSETIKEFALLDGAFVVQGNGTLLSAGTYLVPETRGNGIPQGLGARHQAAAAITAQTTAIAVAVSQSTGTVTVFQRGEIVLTLERAGITRW